MELTAKQRTEIIRQSNTVIGIWTHGVRIMAGIQTLLTDFHIFLSLFRSMQKYTDKPALLFTPDCLLIYIYAAQISALEMQLSVSQEHQGSFHSMLNV